MPWGTLWHKRAGVAILALDQLGHSFSTISNRKGDLELSVETKMMMVRVWPGGVTVAVRSLIIMEIVVSN